MKLSTQFTTVMPLSKSLALFFFLLFPLLGFYYGVLYQKAAFQQEQHLYQYNTPINVTPTVAQPIVHAVCQSDTDCSADQVCTLAGPVMANAPMMKHCYGKNEAIPL